LTASDEREGALDLLTSIARCPKCEAELERFQAAARCTGCETVFPSLARVPVILPNLEDTIREWQNDLAAFDAMMDRTRAGLESDLARFDLLPFTATRLSNTLAANVRNTSQIEAIFSEAGLHPKRSNDLERAEGAETRRTVPLIHHFEHSLRDWGWDAHGSRENAQSCERVVRALGASPNLGRTIVLGAGAGRLAYDLHQLLRPTFTVALDVDPFVLLVANKVLFEDGVDFVETPIDPSSEDQVAYDRFLRRVGEPPDRFALLLADAFAVPFPEGSFDTVITPWFADVAADDFRDVIGVVDHLLPAGGRWINDGPLLYPTTSFGLRYAKNELFELLDLSGFEILNQTTSEVPYFRSPSSAHARLEGVFTFAATKLPEPRARASMATPPWIILPHLKVPLFPGVTALDNSPPAFRQVRSLVDGKRSLNEIANRLEESMALPSYASAVDVAGALLLKVFLDAKGDR
jgi:hypothetical protein